MKRHRLPFLALAMIALAAGISTGLLRVGWTIPGLGRVTAADHGPLMIAGFLGTLIGLERAVALGRPWVYLGPLLTGAGTVARIAGAPAAAAPALTLAGSALLTAALATVLRAHPTLFTGTMVLGAGCWLVGNVAWLAGAPSTGYVTWWASFLVLTIAAERLELTRLLPVARGSRAGFLAIIALLVAAVALGGIGDARAARPTGCALALLALWLLRYDVARRTVRQDGLPRFTAVCLLSGYAWLFGAGILLTWFGAVRAGPAYDAVLHATFLGFVFAMIFGHAPIVFPAVLGVPIPYRPSFYGHLAVLQLSVAMRVVGDVAELTALRRWGALLNAAAIAIFFANTIASLARGDALTERHHADH